MIKKSLLLTCLTILFTTSCSEDILDTQEPLANETSLNPSETIQGFKNWFYSNYNEISDNTESIYSEEEINKIKSQNKLIFGADLDWDRYSILDYDKYYIIHIPMFNSEIKTTFSSDMNMRGYADLAISVEKNTKDYKLCIVEIHPDKAYMKARDLDAPKEMFIDYRRVKSTDPDFSGYVYYKEIDGTSISLYRIVNGKLVK